MVLEKALHYKYCLCCHKDSTKWPGDSHEQNEDSSNLRISLRNYDRQTVLQYGYPYFGDSQTSEEKETYLDQLELDATDEELGQSTTSHLEELLDLFCRHKVADRLQSNTWKKICGKKERYPANL